MLGEDLGDVGAVEVQTGIGHGRLLRACTPVLADAVPHYAAPCCYTIDPASGLITGHFQEGVPELPRRMDGDGVRRRRCQPAD